MSALASMGDRRRSSRSRCVYCGQEAPVRIQISVAMVTASGKPIQGQMRSRSVRTCEQHGEALLLKIADLSPGLIPS